MSDDKVFADGMIVKHPHQNAPDFVKAAVSFKLKDFFEFAKQHQKEGWLNVQVKESRGGKLYAELDTFTPSKKEEYDTGMQQAKQAAAPPATEDPFPNDDIPW